MNELPKCSRCGAPMPPESPEGLCPRCLLALNLATQTEVTGETAPARTPPPTPLPVSDVAKLFPQLEILECLGRGGMGSVYKARQPRLDRIVALKILSPEKQGNPKFADRFEREARALAKLHHPNIVAVYDFGEANGNFYLLMEFVDGLSLRQLLQSRRLSPPEALVIVPKICAALQYAHEQGVVHRDIKPENILMDKEGHVKIADFGIAKILNDGGRANLTEAQAIGTPHYMSPEQIEKPQAVDHRADIYSLGVVFYEMLTGELPLGKFQPPSKKVEVDVRLDDIVLRALEKEPERRYQKVSEVKTHVETVAATNQGGLKQSRTHEGESSQPPRYGSKAVSRYFFSLVAVAILAALAVFFFVFHNHRSVKSDYIGQTWFPFGDSIQITSVDRNAEQVTVKGHYNLVSQDKAALSFDVTTTNPGPTPVAAEQEMQITSGSGDFTLIHPPFAAGLPHISMYGNGHPFASIYFGTIDEAAHESRAQWITNELPADTVNWSPTLAPGEKPDLNKILGTVQILTAKGSYDDALQRLLWYFDHSRTDPGQGGVRLSFALSDWINLGQRFPKAKQALVEIRDADIRQVSQTGGYYELIQEINSINQYLGDDDGALALFKAIEQRRRTHPGERNRLSSALFDWIELSRHYPNAKQALIELRDADTRQFSENAGSADLFQQIDSINQYLGEDDATVALFKTIEKNDPQLAQRCYWYAKDVLIQKGDYATCRKFLGDPQGAFNFLLQMWRQNKQSEQQNAALEEEEKQRLQAMAKTNSVFAHVPVFATPAPFADNNFVIQTCQMIEILVATGNKSEAENIQSQALAVLNDPRLKTAVQDAETKIQDNNSATQDPALIVDQQQPVVVETYPISGARDVQPGETEIRVRFSKKMMDHSWSWSTAWDNSTPDFIGSPHYEADSHVCVAKVQLKPGRTYAFWLNSDNFHNFQDTDGRPSVPYLLIFQTAPAQRGRANAAPNPPPAITNTNHLHAF